MEEEVAKKSSEAIKRIMNDGIATTNIDNLYKLVDIYKDIKEVESMNNYGNYGGRRAGYDNYGEYGNYSEYGRRGYDMRYRGDDYMDRMSNEYGRYMESKERYGANDQETVKAFHFMTKALGEYLDFLHEEADTPQKKQMLNETLQRSMR